MSATIPAGVIQVEHPTGSAWFGGAWFGPGGERHSTFRYALHRNLSPQALVRSAVLVVMLNPSVAGAAASDPTINKLMTMARAWGFTDLYVVNLFAYRATDPRHLRLLIRETDPLGPYTIGSHVVGPANDDVIRYHAERADQIVCAWGSQPWALQRAGHVVELLGGRNLWALRLSTKTGQPWHPLYLPNSTTPFLWERAA